MVILTIPLIRLEQVEIPIHILVQKPQAIKASDV